MQPLSLNSYPVSWCDPLALARAVTDDHFVLLHSAARTNYSGRLSLLALDADSTIEASDFTALEAALSSDAPRYANAWFGYLGYGLRHALETLPPDVPGPLTFPDLRMTRFATIYVFDHETREVTCWSKEPPRLAPAPLPQSAAPRIRSLESNMSRAEYLEKVAHIVDAIHAGDLYQANLTRKYFGRLAETPDRFALFTRLCEASPAPYSAYIQFGNRAILSSSPEQFLAIGAEGSVVTRPIKGTSARHADPALDAASRKALAESEKDRAENMMIVDLMRNDLSRACAPGSVAVDRLFEITSHATIHHMASTVRGQLAPGTTPVKAVQACFPPGSMTGAPKIRAMGLCTELEELARGVYSGAIGWFGGDGSAELSVVIRTLLIEGDRFEFQVGGGIVADSTPEAELGEILDKSMGIRKALGLEKEQMACL